MRISAENKTLIRQKIDLPERAEIIFNGTDIKKIHFLTIDYLVKRKGIDFEFNYDNQTIKIYNSKPILGANVVLCYS